MPTLVSAAQDLAVEHVAGDAAVGAMDSLTENQLGSNTETVRPEEDGVKPHQVSETRHHEQLLPSSVSSSSSNGNDAKQATAERQVKKTCEACVRSKVKCEGTSPCERCLKRGMDCVFLLEQKRGRRPGPLHSSADGSKPPRKRHVTDTVSINAGNTLKKPKVASSPKIAPDLARPRPNSNLSAEVQLPYAPTLNTPSISLAALPNSLTGNPLHSVFSVAPFGQFTSMPPLNYPFKSMWPINPSMLSTSLLSTSFTTAPTSNYLPSNFGASTVAQGLGAVTSPAYHPFQLALQQTFSPSAFEKRMIRVLFALFKHCHKGAPLDETRTSWFEARFNKLLGLLRKRGSVEEQQRLITWMFENRFRVNSSSDQSVDDRLRAKLGPNFATISNQEEQSTRSALELSSKIGTINVFTNFQVECDEVITRMLGYDSSNFLSPGGWNLSGFLPWGAEVLSSVVADDRDVFTYVREMSAAFSQGQQASTGVSRASVERPMTIIHKTGFQIDCIVFSDAIESVNPDGSLLTGVSFHFFLAPVDVASSDPMPEVDLGPWPPSSSNSPMPTDWLESILRWVS